MSFGLDAEPHPRGGHPAGVLGGPPPPHDPDGPRHPHQAGGNKSFSTGATGEATSTSGAHSHDVTGATGSGGAHTHAATAAATGGGGINIIHPVVILLPIIRY